MKREVILDMPVSLDEDIKSLIERAFHSAVEEIQESEFDYIDKKILLKTSSIADTQPPWVANLSLFSECLYEILKMYRQKKDVISEETYKFIGAALFYFINPYDIIPDYTAGIGYADDYFVFILCLNSICEKDRNFILGKLSQVE